MGGQAAQGRPQPRGHAEQPPGLFALGITRATAAQTPPPPEEGQGRASTPQEDWRPRVRPTAGPAQRILEPGRGTFSRAEYTKGEAKGDGMRPHRILSLW